MNDLDAEKWLITVSNTFEPLIKEINNVFTVLVNNMVVFTNSLNTIFCLMNNEDMIRYVAIKYYDIPESDIRRVEKDTVILWNHRKIKIDISYRGRFNNV